MAQIFVSLREDIQQISIKLAVVGVGVVILAVVLFDSKSVVVEQIPHGEGVSLLLQHLLSVASQYLEIHKRCDQVKVGVVVDEPLHIVKIIPKDSHIGTIESVVVLDKEVIHIGCVTAPAYGSRLITG